MMITIKSKVWKLMIAVLIAGLAGNAFGAGSKRPGESAGCDTKLIDRLLAEMEVEIIPVTQESVRNGNKVFSAAMLKKSDLSTIIIGTNTETENPLYHAEVYTINQFQGEN